MTASTSPDWASAWAARGSSNAPGTHTSVTLKASTPTSDSSERAPATRAAVMSSLNRPATIATRSPAPSSDPSGCRPDAPVVIRSLRTFRAVQTVEQVAHALLLGAQVADVLLVRHGLERHPFQDLQAVAVEALVLR